MNELTGNWLWKGEATSRGCFFLFLKWESLFGALRILKDYNSTARFCEGASQDTREEMFPRSWWLRYIPSSLTWNIYSKSWCHQFQNILFTCFFAGLESKCCQSCCRKPCFLSWIHYPESQPFHHLLMLSKKMIFAVSLRLGDPNIIQTGEKLDVSEPINRETPSTQDSEAYLDLQRGIQRKIGFGQTARGVTSTEHPKCCETTTVVGFHRWKVFCWEFVEQTRNTFGAKKGYPPEN